MGDGVETVGGLVVESVHQVPVAVDGYLDRGVPEPGLDGFGVFTGGDQPGGVGVAQVVDPARGADRLDNCLPPDPPEGTPSQEPALVGGPDHLIDRGVLSEVAGQGYWLISALVCARYALSGKRELKLAVVSEDPPRHP